jgi:uncharacterized membrane protein YedE/YeeE
MLGAACHAAVEGFVSGSAETRRDAYVDFAATLLAFIVSLVILGFVGKLLWNNVIVDLFSFAKPARSFWQVVGLMIFVSLVRP